jgi:hypothetical protein
MTGKFTYIGTGKIHFWNLATSVSNHLTLAKIRPGNMRENGLL